MSTPAIRRPRRRVRPCVVERASISAAMPVPVVIVHRDQPERLIDTIDAFRSQDVPVTITVVDNGSRSVPEIAGDDVDVLSMGANLGFGPAANVGYRRVLDAPHARQ